MQADDPQLTIADLAETLQRTEHTIRQWLEREDFPVGLLPERGARNKLLWTKNQLKGLREYAQERASHRGWPKSAA